MYHFRTSNLNEKRLIDRAMGIIAGHEEEEEYCEFDLPDADRGTNSNTHANANVGGGQDIVYAKVTLTCEGDAGRLLYVGIFEKSGPTIFSAWVGRVVVITSERIEYLTVPYLLKDASAKGIAAHRTKIDRDMSSMRDIIRESESLADGGYKQLDRFMTTRDYIRKVCSMIPTCLYYKIQ